MFIELPLFKQAQGTYLGAVIHVGLCGVKAWDGYIDSESGDVFALSPAYDGELAYIEGKDLPVIAELLKCRAEVGL